LPFGVRKRPFALLRIDSPATLRKVARMRPALASLLVLFAARSMAQCVPLGVGCLGGGGPVATDCFVAWSGVSAMSTSCTDGDACDSDGKADGQCTFAVQACINVTGMAGCTASGLSSVSVTPATSATGRELAAALQSLPLSSAGCTSPGIVVPVAVSVAGVKPGKARLLVTATATSGKRDKDKLRLTCLPSAAAPSFAAVQDIFTRSCVSSSCHDSLFHAENQDLSAGASYASSVGVKSVEVPKLDRVKPGSVRGSFLARKILGQGIPAGLGGGIMPQGCPSVPIVAGSCLTDAEKYTILSWIAHGAPAQ
jgi:hypothetical protein